MSIEVALDDLAEEISRRGPGYLLTAGGASRPHVMHVVVTVDGSRLRAPIGRSAAANIDAQPSVTMLWPPDSDGGLSLIVDGEATVAAEPETDGNPVAVVEALGAVLHRPA